MKNASIISPGQKSHWYKWFYWLFPSIHHDYDCNENFQLKKWLISKKVNAKLHGKWNLIASNWRTTNSFIRNAPSSFCSNHKHTLCTLHFVRQQILSCSMTIPLSSAFILHSISTFWSNCVNYMIRSCNEVCIYVVESHSRAMLDSRVHVHSQHSTQISKLKWQTEFLWDASNIECLCAPHFSI